MIKVTIRALFVAMMIFGLNTMAKTAAKTKPAAATTTKTSTTPVQESYFADFEYELQTGLSRGGIQSFKAGGETNTIIEGEASITKVIRSNIQAGAEAHFYNQSGGGGSSYFEVMAIGIYNLDNNLKESLYGKAGVGMLNIVNDKFKNESKIGFMVGGGKRIPLMDKVAYTPEGRLIIVDGGTRFQILALNFSLFY